MEDNDGILSCFGDNEFDKTSIPNATYTSILHNGLQSFSVGPFHICVVITLSSLSNNPNSTNSMANNNLLCWGRNENA